MYSKLCVIAHSKILSGVCPWCACTVIQGKAQGRKPVLLKGVHARSVKDGRTFQQLVQKKGSISLDTAVGYIRGAAERLAELHDCNFVHGRLTPRNVFLLDDNSVAIVFDTSQSDGNQNSCLNIAQEIESIENASYLAPEQITVGGEIDSRSDVYSLGCVFYFLLTGHSPFAAGTVAKCLYQNLHQILEPADIDQPELSKILKKMMEKEPRDRFQSATEVVATITDYQNNQGA